MRHAYESLEDLLDDTTVDVVHVTSPNDLHLSQARDALAAGKHVVCEKPLAMSADESAELVRMAAASGLVNATNFNIRYYPLNQHANEFIAGRPRRCAPRDRRYFQDRLLSRATGIGGCSPIAAGRCARSATSVLTGSTS